MLLNEKLCKFLAWLNLSLVSGMIVVAALYGVFIWQSVVLLLIAGATVLFVDWVYDEIEKANRDDE